jgi:hypothetical protein
MGQDWVHDRKDKVGKPLGNNDYHAISQTFKRLVADRILCHAAINDRT